MQLGEQSTILSSSSEFVMMQTEDLRSNPAVLLRVARGAFFPLLMTWLSTVQAFHCTPEIARPSSLEAEVTLVQRSVDLQKLRIVTAVSKMRVYLN